jgi:hypothetical protein
MKNTHLEHPEDTILTGDLSVLDWFTEDSHLSLKIDGAPAIVWGTDPATGTFFVGTKSVFNKKLIKINHSHEEIDSNHVGNVADILHHCLDNLPNFSGIIQGDFIGYGGDCTFCPNTITYVFQETIQQDIIVAPHTIYVAKTDLRDAIASPMILCPKSTDHCLFIAPKCEQLDEDWDGIVSFARQMSTLCEFMDDKQAKRVKQQLNACIREGFPIDDIVQDAIAIENDIDVNVLRLWSLVKSIKDDMLFTCSNNGPDAYIGLDECDGEGYVRTNDLGMYKLVNRELFSHANFNKARNWEPAL